MKKIIFKARDKDSFDICLPPISASAVLPDWWKTMPPYLGKEMKLLGVGLNATGKKCMPMLDALTSGYIVSLWSDVIITQTKNCPLIQWKIKTKDVFQLHNLEATKFLETPNGYGSEVFKFMNAWIPILPKGYSYLITEPFGFKNLPFKAIPAVIDGDKSTLEIITPVWLKKGFEGIVEKGTPMFQIIPFKRDEWKSELTFYENGEYAKVEDKNFNGTIINHYIKKHWSRKIYK